MRKIKSCIAYINIVSALIALALSIIFYFNINNGGFIIDLFPILVTIALVGSVLHIRRTIS